MKLGVQTGVINFIRFTFSALLGPVFGARAVSASADSALGLVEYRAGFQPLLYGVGLAMILTSS